MKKRRQHVSEDGVTIFQHKTQSSTSMNGRSNTDPIPTDLIFEILLRLPAKSIARCRCVSKLWASILLRPDFTELFLTRSSSRPQLLFSGEKNGHLLVFSAPQFQNPDENSSLVSPTYYKNVPFDYLSSEVCGHVRGLVCLTHLRILKGRKETLPVIYNPSTGQSLTLPRVKTRRVKVRSFFVYDPIGKQFKVLSMTWPCYGSQHLCNEYQILTLGTQNLSWRAIKCCIPHHPAFDGICINGCLYYQAMVDNVSGISTIVVFDVRSEKFRFIRKARGMVLYDESTLVNYEGRLCALQTDGVDGVTGQSRCVELWVLVDAEKHEWSKHVYALPPLWKSVVAEAKLYFVGMTGTNEIVLSPRYSSGVLCVFYYNFERNTVIRVEIHGRDVFKHLRVHTFLDYVEDVKLMQM